MKRSVSYLKIRKDTRNHKGGELRGFEAPGRGVPALTGLAGREQSCVYWALREGRVCAKKEKSNQKFKVSRICPLILSKRRDKMINNMVLSSEIEWIGYEHKRNMLQVEFIVGSVYQYEGVPEVVYKDFLTAPSHGRFFESNIKGKYQYRKVR